MVNRFGKIGVLMGGVSSERSVSLRSGNAVATSLTQAGYIVEPIDVTVDDHDKLIKLIQAHSIDIAFIALHGRLGEDGTIQSILEELDLPYTGSGIKASQMAFNKILTQMALKQAGVAVPKHCMITDGQKIDFKAAWAKVQKTPLVVKAACEGSSIGVHIVRHPAEWESAIKDALNYGPNVIIEEFIKGEEFTVGIFDQKPLPVVAINPKTNFFSFNAKYQKGMTDYVCPASIPEDLAVKMQTIALKAYQVIECAGFARVDIRTDAQLNPYVLEINTIPGFTETSLFPKAAQVAGYNFCQVCEQLLELGYAKKRR